MTDYVQFRPQGQQVGLCGKDGMMYVEPMAEHEGEVEEFPAMACIQVPRDLLYFSSARARQGDWGGHSVCA